MNIAVILAGGSGRRMNMKGSKQLLEINEKPVFKYSFDIFKKIESFEKIIVVYNTLYENEFKEVLKDEKDVILVPSGEERFDSSFNALKYIKREFKNCKIVAIHDGARPFIKEETIIELLTEMNNNNAVIPGIRCKDTIKMVNENNIVKNTPDRKYLRNIQTPQLFDFNMLYSFYQKLDTDKDFVTDDASVFEINDEKVKIIEGSEKNIKITTQDDVLFSEYIIKKNGEF